MLHISTHFNDLYSPKYAFWKITVNSKNDQLIESFDPVYSVFRLVTKKFLRFWHVSCSSEP